ncbi:hypothetical protein S4054249_25075 [Pseudoalteromonas luteoviolacea]|uniref:Uncharacterized protein n=2 Tax=Pseudoalteromonas luteoviolacea TaxID=43657 RepID=A0A0F6A8P1_9GAMM|nr:hypothetical protein S4054249_25075 [Pseudoalteromonas luteoviolacea]AOT15728.1 hypothetical protein S40542_23435 [Pseudoalteromonas luteoviolacea]AOT20929.1 hypothetical protein S4054_24995 [Pseudoalteromonas luteoviolacea]KKE82211.1 hypothetical protein N479_19125 [Pseudoalteromonas luteoviolacea S4054]KZN65457.1 hypothetical protein N481_25210 [Pseudoalteromonas luteoviolacea S4047-1]
MRVIIFLSLISASFLSSASDIYFRGSKCKADNNVKDVYFRDTTIFDQKFPKHEALASLKQTLLTKAYDQISSGKSYVIQSLRFKQDEEKLRVGKSLEVLN